MAKSKTKAAAQPELIPAVAYLRKSTKGEKADGKQRQEKSLPQQRAEILKLVRGRYQIVKWFEDEGVSGWKRGAKRPDFQRMLAEVKALGVQAIVCDNIDRFSRATVDEVQIDAHELRQAGVRWIVTASHGNYDLGKRHDIGEILKFAVAVWSSHEYSRQLGRRMALARRNAAMEGRRAGGRAAYGLKNDGKGGLKRGDPSEVKTVLWIFREFVERLKSLHWIAGDLNARRVAGPEGGDWYVNAVARLLRRKCYRGDFSFNESRKAQFFGIDERGEVVEASELKGPGKVFFEKGVYEALVPPALFDKAQRRLELLKRDRGRRKREGYPLSGVLVCDHCGGPMYGTPQKGDGSPIVYRCNSPALKGKGACRMRQVREDRILPFILGMLGKEIADIAEMLERPPADMIAPGRKRRQNREVRQAERDRLAARIELAEENVMSIEDQRTRQSLDRKITELRDELDRLDAALSESSEPDYTREEWNSLRDWWQEFDKRTVSVPIDGKRELPTLATFYQDPFADERALLIDAKIVNEKLLELGCEVRLRWRTEEFESKSGRTLRRHILVRGRFRLGHQNGKLPRYVLEPSST